jgi:hypothetical protein
MNMPLNSPGVGTGSGILTASPTVITIGARPSQICSAVGVPVLIFNADLTNVAYVGYRNTIGVSNAQPVQPLTYTVMDGTRQLWAFCPTATVVLNVTPGGTYASASPAQIAAQIQLAGIYNLSKSTLVAAQGLTVIGAAGNATPINAQPITQTGYEIGLTLQTNVAATLPGASVVLTWTDSVSGSVVSTEKWLLVASNAAAQVYTGTGPTKGDTLSLTITNTDPVQNLTYSLTFTQNSRSYSRDDWRQTTTFAIPTQASTGYDQSANILHDASPSIVGGASSTHWFPIYAGKTSWALFNGPNAGSFFQINTILESGVPTQQIYQSPVVAANAPFYVSLDLPRASCQAVITNGAGAAQTVALVGVISEQLS